MFAIVRDLQIDAQIVAQRGQHGGDETVAAPGDRPFAALMRDLAGEDAVARMAGLIIIDQLVGLVDRMQAAARRRERCLQQV